MSTTQPRTLSTPYVQRDSRGCFQVITGHGDRLLCEPLSPRAQLEARARELQREAMDEVFRRVGVLIGRAIQACLHGAATHPGVRTNTSKALYRP